MSTNSVKHVLFVCFGNSSRSQVAEAFAKIHGAEFVASFSAGVRPSGKIDDKAVAGMQERGYDLSVHRPKGLSEVPDIEYDAVVTMGCEEQCPAISAKRCIAWELPSPSSNPPSELGQLCDMIEHKVKELFADLSREGP